MNKTLLLTSASAFALVLAAYAPAYAADGAHATSTSTAEDNISIDNGSVRDNDIDNSWNGGATGIVHDQQNNGANNGIGAATAVHADVTGGTSLDTSATATSTAEDNDSTHNGIDDEDWDNRIEDTMNGFVGSATMQQNNGDNNAINAATALDGVDGSADGVVQEAKATADTDGNTSSDDDSEADNDIDPSFNGAAGVFTIQQNNGSNNAISAATAVLGVTGDAGSIEQKVTADATAFDNYSRDLETDRDNEIEGSFNEGFAGVVTVQQNNGHSNAIAAGTGVIGVGGSGESLTQHAIANGFGQGAFGNDTESDLDDSDWHNDLGDDDGPETNLPVFVGAVGVVTVQQNNGDANGIAAATAVTGIAGKVDDIHQGVGVELGFSGAAGNAAFHGFGAHRDNRIDHGSFNDAKGVFTLQQNNGSANSVGAATAVAGVAGNSGNIDQHALNGLFLTGSGWNGDVDENDGSQNGRDNDIGNSLDKMKGVVTVQQNNGDANNIGSGTGLVAVGGTSGDVLQTIVAGTGLSGAASNDVEIIETELDNEIDNSFDDFTGIATVQQNNGNVNNMVAMTTAIMTNGAGKVDQDISASNVSLDNVVDSEDTILVNDILESFNNPEGVLTVQQNNGHANSIVAATGLVLVNGDTGRTKQKAAAWGASINNDLDEIKADQDNMIDPSFTSAEGILTVQQNNGSGNAITALNAVVANTGGAADTKQKVKAGGEVIKNDSVDIKSSRTNTLTDSSFENLSGVATVQQNNGNGNVMSTATAVAFNTGDGKLDDTRQKVKTYGLVNRAKAKDIDKTRDEFGKRLNTLDDHAFDNSQGIVTVQQNNGDNNVMASAVGVRAETQSILTSSPGEDDVSRQLASTKGTVKRSTAKAEDKDFRTDARKNSLHDAFLGGVDGVFTVQQNNGDNNVIGSSIAVAANINSADDLDSAMNNDAKTKGTSKRNKARDLETGRDNGIHGNLFGDASGIMTVQQNNGSNNVMGSAVGVVANVNTGFRFGNAVTADATGKAKVTKNDAIVEGVERRNRATDSSFNGAQGVMTLQQNNGDNNVMGSAVNVVVTTEVPGFGPAASTASLSATVSGNTVTVDDELSGSLFDNTVESSFNGAAGLMTVQQNNGSNNAMGSAITTVANGITFSFGGVNP